MLNLWSDDESTTVRLWSLSDDTLVEDEPDPGSFTVVSRWGEFQVKDAEPVAVESLRRMAFGPVSLRNTLPDEHQHPAAALSAVAALETVLDELGGVVVHSLGLPDGQGPLMSLIPAVAHPRFRPVDVPPGRPVRLSRFATMRPLDRTLLLEVPGAEYRVELARPPARAVAAALATPCTVESLAPVALAPAAVVADLVSFLVAAGTVVVADPDGCFADETDPVQQGWAHHELLFHQNSRSRQGTMPADLVVDDAAAEPSPVTRTSPPGRRFPLPRPDLAAITAYEPPLTALLEIDHTCPLPGGELTLGQLGELLYRTARVRSTGPAHIPMRGGLSYEASQRPYLSIACLYELEIYLTINRCAGLPVGIYHYDPLGHAVVLVDDSVENAGMLLDLAKVGVGSLMRSAAVVTVAARMERTAWLLAGSAYAVALLHCGGLQQMLYLVGRAAGVAAHPVLPDGTGVDELLRLRWPAEVALGECVLDPCVT